MGSVVLWVRLLKLPPVTATSSAVKSLLSSDRVKVMTAVSPAARAAALLVMATVGGVVSMVKGVRLLAVVTPFCVTLSTG